MSDEQTIYECTIDEVWEYEWYFIDSTHVKVRMKGTEKWSQAWHIAQLSKVWQSEISYMKAIHSF